MPILATLRTSLLLAFKSLPLLLLSFITFLAFGLGNSSLFILLAGQAIVVPIITELAHLVSSSSPNIALLSSNDISQLISIPATGPVNVFPSYWMAHISFFFGYLLSNAVRMFIQAPDLSLIRGASSDAIKSSINAKIAARKEKAVSVMISTLVFLVLITIMRIIATGAETLAGITFAIVVLGSAGFGWYYAAETLGATNSDVFGIAVQMMAPDSGATKPKTCVYTGKPR
jgi:hypothetical protein